jgi:hypothetical protein
LVFFFAHAPANLLHAHPVTLFWSMVCKPRTEARADLRCVARDHRLRLRGVTDLSAARHAGSRYCGSETDVYGPGEVMRRTGGPFISLTTTEPGSIHIWAKLEKVLGRRAGPHEIFSYRTNPFRT